MFDFNQLSPEPDKTDGVWTRCKLPGRDGKLIDTGCDLLIAYALNNPALRHRQAALTATAQRLAKGRPLNQAEDGDIIRRSAVGTVLKDWKGYVLDGQEVPFSEPAAEKALLASDQLSNFVAGFSGNLDNFRTADPAEAAPSAIVDPDHDGEEEQDATTEGVLKTVDAVV